MELEAETYRTRCSPAAPVFLNLLFSKALNQFVKELREGCLLTHHVGVRGFKEGKNELKAIRVHPEILNRSSSRVFQSAIIVISIVPGDHVTGLSINIFGVLSLLILCADTSRSGKGKIKKRALAEIPAETELTNPFMKHSGSYSCSVREEQLPAHLA